MGNRRPLSVWEARLSRWGAPATYVTVVFLAGALLVGILVRSPDTKSNFQASREGYDRTALASMSGPNQYMGLRDNLPVEGKSIYVGAGCALCHGLHGAGGAVGPAVWTISPSTMSKTLRSGGNGMPSYAPERLSDDQIAKIVAYLKDMKAQYPDEPELKPAHLGPAASRADSGAH